MNLDDCSIFSKRLWPIVGDNRADQEWSHRVLPYLYTSRRCSASPATSAFPRRILSILSLSLSPLRSSSSPCPCSVLLLILFFFFHLILLVIVLLNLRISQTRRSPPRVEKSLNAWANCWATSRNLRFVRDRFLFLLNRRPTSQSPVPPSRTAQVPL